MSLVKWDPFRGFDNMFSPSSRFMSTPDFYQMESDWRPLVDVIEDGKEYLIKVELPEVKKKDIKVTADNGYLTIKGERKFEKKDKKLHTMERFYGNFERSFSLPDNVDDEHIKADFKDGLLELHLTKTEIPHSQHKRIHVD